MDKTSIKWLLAGLAGAVLTITLLVVVAVVVVKNLPRFAYHDGEFFFVSEQEEVPIREQWADWQQRYQENQQADREEIERLELEKRYEVVPLHDDTRERLYKHRDFALVEERLAEQFAACEQPLDHYRYSQHVENLGNFTRGESPLAHLAVLDAWVEARPDAYHARLIRGWFGHKYYSSLHHTAVSDEAAEAGWVDAKELLQQASNDLERASELNPLDPEVHSAFMRVEFARGKRRWGLQEYYEQALKRCPTHLGAREMWLHAAQPDYGGTLDDVLAVGEEAREASSEFPLLLLISRTASYIYNSEMDRVTHYHGDTLAAYEAQLEFNSNDAYLMAHAAYFAMRAKQWERAVHWFDTIGDVYPEDGPYENLAEYNRDRARAYAMYAKTDSVRGTPKAEELRAKALELHPNPTE